MSDDIYNNQELSKIAGEEDRKKIYKITSNGMELLKSEYKRLHELYKNGTNILEEIK